MRQLPVGLPGLMNTNARRVMPFLLASVKALFSDAVSSPHPFRPPKRERRGERVHLAMYNA